MTKKESKNNIVIKHIKKGKVSVFHLIFLSHIFKITLKKTDY